MKTKKELIKRWLEKGERDLLSVEHELTFSDMVSETICFHCQQAVEKFLKAYLIYLDIDLIKTHEIGELINKCEEKDNEISSFKEEADKLTDYAVLVRYPDELFEPTNEDAKEAFEIATKVKVYIKNKIVFK